MKHFNSFLSATTRYCGGVEHNSVFISVSSHVDLLPDFLEIVGIPKRWTSLYHRDMGQIFRLNCYF